MKIIPTIMAIFLSLLTTDVFGHIYEKKLIDSHVIHIVYLNPKEYQAEIVKANNGNIGRETVSSMAQKFSADIAVNGGFFEIGGKIDGKPSATLVIQGRVYNVKELMQPLVVIKNGVISINQDVPENYHDPNISLVSGIPMLINNGQIPEDLLKKESEFYIKPHARTALGIDRMGRVIIIVAEHYYTKDIATLTMEEVYTFIKEKGVVFTTKYQKQNLEDITLSEIKQILRDEFSSQAGTKGLTILELAKLMQNLGCQYAINLDGGGSSTLWINGRVVNNTFGDQDEAAGEKIERPVSDSIIFRKK